MKQVICTAIAAVFASATVTAACDYAEYDKTKHDIDGVTYEFAVQEVGIVVAAALAHGPDRKAHEADALMAFHAVTGCDATIRPGTVFEFQGAGEIPAYVWLLPKD